MCVTVAIPFCIFKLVWHMARFSLANKSMWDDLFSKQLILAQSYNSSPLVT